MTAFPPSATPEAQREEGRAGDDEKNLDNKHDPVVRPIERDTDANDLTTNSIAPWRASWIDDP